MEESNYFENTVVATRATGLRLNFRASSSDACADILPGKFSTAHGLDSIVVGYYKGKDLVYVARVRNGFVPASRRQVFERLATIGDA